MALLEKQLVVKRSQLPGAGKGLFTRAAIAKGTRILEYKGKITTWKDVDHQSHSNGYIYYVTRNHVIDAGRSVKSLARYANDARGLTRVKGVLNNTEYLEDANKRVFIVAKRNIAAGEEILVPYGKEYWDVIRHNMKVDRKSK